MEIMELVTALVALLGEGGDPTDQLSLIDGWGAANAQSLTDGAAATETANTRVAELEAELQAVKAHNYELLISGGSEVGEGGEEAAETGGEEATDDDANISIEELFEKKED